MLRFKVSLETIFFCSQLVLVGFLVKGSDQQKNQSYTSVEPNSQSFLALEYCNNRVNIVTCVKWSVPLKSATNLKKINKPEADK